MASRRRGFMQGASASWRRGVVASCRGRQRHGVVASCRGRQRHGRGVHGERRDADLALDFLPGRRRIRRVLDVEQRVVDPGECHAGVLILAAGSENHMPGTEEGAGPHEIGGGAS